MVRYVYIQFNQSSVPLLYAIRGEWFVMFTSPSGLLSQLSSSFSVGLMRVPAGHHTFPLLVKEPVLHCHKRGENFQRYLLNKYFEALPAFPSTKLPTCTGRPDLNMLSQSMRHRPWPGLRWSTESANLNRARVLPY